jgi:hypothetical protein
MFARASVVSQASCGGDFCRFRRRLSYRGIFVTGFLFPAIYLLKVDLKTVKTKHEMNK